MDCGIRSCLMVCLDCMKGGVEKLEPIELISVFFSFFFNLFFYWRIIALRNFVVFCQTSTWINHRYAYIPSLLNIPSPTPSHPWRATAIGLQRVRHDWATSFTFHFHALEKEMATHSSVLAWRIPWRSLVGCSPWGHTELNRTEAT